MVKVKSNRFVLFMLLISVFGALMLFSSFNYNFIIEKLKEDPTNLHELRVSGPEINITTPENITYTEPMSGYFPATYGFESHTDGTLPSYLVKVDDYPISVVSSRSGHNKVLWFDDNGYSYRASCYNNFSLNVDNGTIELWFLIDDAYDRTGLITRQGNTALVQFSSRYDKWKYHTSTQTDLNMQRATGGDMPSPLDNTWHHIRIDFECTTGEYSGLDQYTWKCWIDGIESAEMPFQNNATFVDNFYMSTSTAHTSYNMYIDAIGYSWDPHYNVGDNLVEGLLLSYDTSFIPDWQGYSLDGQTNRTIIGNKTIPFPSLDGIHTIQVFGNNSIGTMYESDIRYFTIKFIEIITPKNRTYTEPMNGYYPATYGFENDRVGDDPNEWIVDENQGTVQVVSEIDNHKNIVELHDTDPSSGDGVQLNQTLNNVISGTIELWFRTNDASKDCYINIMDGTTHSNEVALYIYSGAWQYYDTSFHAIISASSNRWYHIRIEFDCASNWHLWIDGDQKDSGGYSFKGSPVSMDGIVIRTKGTDSDYYLYVDSIGYSWDLNYNVGDNLNGGLLLSFDTGFNPDWIGYSLDNQLNKTILGNTTFPYPSLDGIHTIQVFGNNTMGSMYESDIRYFTINTTYYLNIITPENTTYTEPMSGYYPATYGFEDDTDGTLPSYLVNVGNYPISVVSSRSGHNKVLWFDDNGYSYRASCYNNFSINVDNGTIEYWFLVDDAYDRTGLAIRQEKNNLVSMGSRYDQWRYQTATQTDLIIQKATGGNMPAPLDNTWHHIRIAFECTTGNFLGLDQYTWKCWIDGVESAEMPFQNDEFYSDNFYMSTSTAHTSYNMYIDAIGYSWDPFYSIGDNLHEGLLFSFDTSFTPEWIGYSLDNQLNKTILGNTTFPYPSLNGIHTIQVFGNNSIGTIYESDIRYFTMDITITPPQILINSPLGGNYFGFNAPNYDISITTSYFDSKWYTLDAGSTNITFVNELGTIDQVEWQNYGHGAVTIRFYVNDTYGQEEYDEVTINKDLNPPSSTLSFTPYMGINIVNESTIFIITANDFSESGVSIIRYRINNSGWLTYSGAFTLLGLPPGDYSIKYQAIDVVGNVESEQSIVVNLYHIPEPPPELPIEIIILIIVLASVGSALVAFTTLFVYKRSKSRIFVDEKKPKIIKSTEAEKLKRIKIQRKKSIKKPLITNCPFCQAELPGNQKFCVYCGANLEE